MPNGYITEPHTVELFNRVALEHFQLHMSGREVAQPKICCDSKWWHYQGQVLLPTEAEKIAICHRWNDRGFDCLVVPIDEVWAEDGLGIVYLRRSE